MDKQKLLEERYEIGCKIFDALAKEPISEEEYEELTKLYDIVEKKLDILRDIEEDKPEFDL